MNRIFLCGNSPKPECALAVFLSTIASGFPGGWPYNV